MNQLVWRLHRNQVYFAVAGFFVLTVLLIITGLRMANDYHAFLRTCAATQSCADGGGQLFSGDGAIMDVVNLTIAAPLLLGLFWGAPLVAKDFEDGSHNLVWTQGVTRQPACQSGASGDKSGIVRSLASHGFRQVVTFQPEAALIGLTFWRVLTKDASSVMLRQRSDGCGHVFGEFTAGAKYSSIACARPLAMVCWPPALAAIVPSNGSVMKSGSMQRAGHLARRGEVAGFRWPQ